MPQLPKLYGFDKNDAVKEWEIVVDGAIITVHHGKQGGKITSKSSPAPKPKSQPTSELQARFNAQSKWNKQKDKGYAESVEEIPVSKLPPLAHKYYEHVSKVKPGWVASYKLNGVNDTAYFMDNDVVFKTRGGKDYPVIEDIADVLKEVVFNKHPDWHIVGEIYCHGMWLEDITSATKKHNEDTHKLELHIFQVFIPESPKMGYKDRMETISQMFSAYGKPSRVRVVPLFVMDTVEQFDAFHARAVELKYEGTCIMDPDAPFEFKNRSTTYLKRKDSIDSEFEFLGLEKDKNGGGVPVVALPGKADLAVRYFMEHGTWEKADRKVGVFRANKKGTHEERRALWAEHKDLAYDKGLWLKVEFESWSKEGVPLKPIGVAFRECDTDGQPTE